MWDYLAFDPTTQRGPRILPPQVLLRVARMDELGVLRDIDRDASRLFDRAGLQMAAPHELEFAAAERTRWLD
jgi:hypothetical protein